MSNLIALLDNNNNIGLGTNHIGIGTTNSALPFKKIDNTILLDFDATTSKVKLGTVGVGTWEGTPIAVAYGGLGNIGTGTAGYVLKSNGNSLIWAAESGGGGGGGGGDITTSTNIATSASSNITIGTTSKELTINTNKLNVNLGTTNPSNGQVLKYNSSNATLEWGNLSATNLDNLWQLMKTFHPGYVFLLKSITVNDGSSNQSLVPSFNSNTINYTVNIGEILTVSILPTTFDSSTITQINNSSINDPNSYILLNTNNTFTIKNTYPNSSYNKIYTLNINRQVFQDNNLDNIVIQPVGIGTTGDVNLLTNIDTTNTVYNVDVESNVKTISLTPTFHRTVTQLNIGNSSSTTENPEITRIGVGTIGIGTAFIGIGTTIIQGTNNSVSNNSTIGVGTISSVYVSVKAENTSLKNYEFKISNPPRTNTDLKSIEFILSNSNGNSTSHTLTNPQPGNHEETDNGSDSPFHIENIYDKITINIIKSHFNQQVIINKNNLSTGVSGDIFNLTPFTQPVANGIIDTFNILNTAPIGVGTATYSLVIKRKPSTENKLSNIRITSTTNDTLLNSLLTFSSTTTDYTTGDNIIYTKETNIKITCTKITSGQRVTYNSTSEDSTTGTLGSVKTLALSPTITNGVPVNNLINITVTAEDNTNTQTYEFKAISDNIAPTITSITHSGVNTYVIGDILTITLTFDEIVSINSNNVLNLSNGAQATINSSSNTNTQIFTYNIIENTTGNNKNTNNLSINSIGGDTIKDLYQNNLDTSIIPKNFGNDIIIDANRPIASIVSSTSANQPGDIIIITLNFTEDVEQTNSELTLKDNDINGSVIGTASYYSGSGSSTLIFRYTVPSNVTTSNNVYLSGFTNIYKKNFSRVSCNSISGSLGNVIIYNDYIGSTTNKEWYTNYKLNETLLSNFKAGIKIKLPSVNKYLGVGLYGFGLDNRHVEFLVYSSGHSNNFTIEYISTENSNFRWKIKLIDGISDASLLNVAYLYSYIYNPNNISDTDGNGDYTVAPVGENDRTKLNIEHNNGTYSIHAKSGFYVDTTSNVNSGYYSMMASQPKYIWDFEFTNTNISLTAPSGHYKAGDSIVFTLTFNENMTLSVPNKSFLKFNNNSVATYTSGSGSTSIIFTYNVSVNDINTTNLQFETYFGTIKNSENEVPYITGSLSNIVIDTVSPSFISISATSGIYIYNYNTNNANDIITITLTFDEPVNISNASLNLSNNGSAYYSSGSGTTNIIFTYTIDAAVSSNTDDLSVNSYNGSITDLAGNNLSNSISGSLGGVKIIVLSSFGLSDTQNQVYTLKLASYGNRALSVWYHTSMAAFSNLVANVVGNYSQYIDSIKWKLTNISIVGNDLIADIESTEQTVRTPGSHNGDYFSVAKHSQNMSDVSNFNNPTHNAPSTIGGENRIKLIKQSSGIFYIQHSNNSYLINKDVWEGGGVVDPAGWESGTPGNIGKWTFFNY